MRTLLRRPLVQKLLWVAVLLAAWQGVVYSGLVSPLLLPGLGQIGRAWWQAVANGHLLLQVGYSLYVILAGLILGAALAVLLGQASLFCRPLASLADTLCALAHPLPAVALMPIIIVWFGIGTGAIVAIIVHASLWPMLLNLRTGLGQVPAMYVETGRSLQLGAAGMARHIYLPASVPYLFAGAKIGWARAWRALISAEMIFGAAGKYGGLGWFIHQGRVFMDTAALFAGVATVVLVGMAMEAAMNLVERRFIAGWGAV